MTAFGKTWDGDARLVYGWEDDTTVEFSVDFRGPITEAMLNDEDAVPSLFIRGNRTFVLKAIEYVEKLMTQSEAYLRNFFMRYDDEYRNEAYYLRKIEQLKEAARTGNVPDDFYFNSDDASDTLNNDYRAEEFWTHFKNVTSIEPRWRWKHDEDGEYGGEDERPYFRCAC